MPIRVMFDSTTPDAIPAKATMVAGYVDGRFAWPAAAFQRFAGRSIVRINVTGNPANGGDCLDVERGDATPSQAPVWYDARRAAGARNLAIYCNRSMLPAVNRAMGKRSFYRWIATLDGTLHIDGFKPFAGPAAVQFGNATMAGIHVDVSLVFEDQWHREPSLADAISDLTSAEDQIQQALNDLAKAGKQTQAGISLVKQYIRAQA